MNKHARVAGHLWAIAGLLLLSASVWGQIKGPHWSFLIFATFGAGAALAGVRFGRPGILSKLLIWLVVPLVLLYCFAWLFLGGVEDAALYAPYIILAATLSAYTVFAAAQARKSA